MERKLAAILATDVVGYSALMERDEAGTYARLREGRKALFEPEIEKHHGRIFKLMGDGLLAEFGSVVSAVECAVSIQRGLAERNASVTEDQRIQVRIGINLGEVIVEGDDRYGEGVNIAARLEQLAEPGGICVSGKVAREVEKKLAFGFASMGDQQVKNITEPVPAYRVVMGDPTDVSATSGEPMDLSLPSKPSIAVLPFTNMSGDSEQEYFADGIVEDIITALSRAQWLFVIARNSSFTYKGRSVDLKQVGRELGVRYVLEGSVRKAGNRVRITSQLIDASTGAHLWADRFDGELADIFDLQDQVTQKVVGAIAPKLEMAEIERAKRKPTENLDAYDFYLRGMAAFHRFTKSANEEALALFTKAFERDPEFASAYGMAARCYAQRKGFGWIADPSRESTEARQLARKAAAFGRDDAIALAAAGFALFMFGEVADGAAFIDRALDLNPNLGWAWHIGGLTKALVGQPEAVAEYAAHAMRLSPQDPQLFAMHMVAGLGLFFAGRYDEAFSNAEVALRERSNFSAAAGVAAASAALAGRSADAERAMTRLLEIDPTLCLSNLRDWLPFQRPEEFDLWAEGLRKAGLPD